MSDEDYELRWPRELLADELGRLLELSSPDLQRERAKTLLADAFVSAAPEADLDAISPRAVSTWGSQGRDPWNEPKNLQASFLESLRDRLPTLDYQDARAPYYSQRQAGSAPASQLGVHGVATAVRALILHLAGRGYFEGSFGKDCPDDPHEVDAEATIEVRLGRRIPFVSPADHLAEAPTDLCDLIEVLHDLAAFPRVRRWHNWDNCGWHHSDFSVAVGRGVYRWAVNRILDRSDLGLRIADDGEDRGRLVTTTDPARSTLARQMADRADDVTGDRVRHALSLFRARGATEHDKRSACVALAGILEERRPTLEAGMLSKDEGALFLVANKFAIRHQNAQQQSDYDPVFLDWVFWNFLATVELSDQLLARAPRDDEHSS